MMHPPSYGGPHHATEIRSLPWDIHCLKNKYCVSLPIFICTRVLYVLNDLLAFHLVDQVYFQQQPMPQQRRNYVNSLLRQYIFQFDLFECFLTTKWKIRCHLLSGYIHSHSIHDPVQNARFHYSSNWKMSQQVKEYMYIHMYVCIITMLITIFAKVRINKTFGALESKCAHYTKKIEVIALIICVVAKNQTIILN